MMGGKGSAMRPISASNITINNLYVIVNGRVVDILRTTSNSSIITAINSYIIIKPIIDTMRSNICTEQYTNVIWVMGVRVSGMGPISSSRITINSFYNIARGSVSGIFRSISTYAQSTPTSFIISS